MSESFWDAEVVVESGSAPNEYQPAIEAQPRAAEPPENSAAARESSAAPRALMLSADEFAGLEDRVLRAVSLVKQEKQARLAAEERAARAEAALKDESRRAAQMQEELAALRSEREQVKTRVDRLLEQLDALEL